MYEMVIRNEKDEKCMFTRYTRGTQEDLAALMFELKLPAGVERSKIEQAAKNYSDERCCEKSQPVTHKEVITSFIAGYDCRMKETGDYPFEEQIHNLKATLELEEYNNTQLQAEIDELKQKLERATLWFDVMEDVSFPKHGELVLVKNKDGDISTARYFKGTKPMFIIDFSEISDRDVTHFRYID